MILGFSIARSISIPEIWFQVPFFISLSSVLYVCTALFGDLCMFESGRFMNEELRYGQGKAEWGLDFTCMDR